MAFPDNVQTFIQAVDPSTTLDVQNIQNYQTYIANGDFIGAQNFLAQMTNGIAMNLNAGRYNEVIQTIQDIQTFYFGLNGVVDYINSNINKYVNIAPYSNTINYVAGNLVGTNSTYYLCTQNNGPNSIVVEPNVSENWENYWSLFLQPQNPKQYPIQSTQPTGQNIGDLWFQQLN